MKSDIKGAIDRESEIIGKVYEIFMEVYGFKCNITCSRLCKDFNIPGMLHS